MCNAGLLQNFPNPTPSSLKPLPPSPASRSMPLSAGSTSTGPPSRRSGPSPGGWRRPGCAMWSPATAPASRPMTSWQRFLAPGSNICTPGWCWTSDPLTDRKTPQGTMSLGAFGCSGQPWHLARSFSQLSSTFCWAASIIHSLPGLNMWRNRPWRRRYSSTGRLSLGS